MPARPVRGDAGWGKAQKITFAWEGLEMKRLLGLIALLLLVSLPAVAQIEAPSFEVGGGWAFRDFAPPAAPLPPPAVGSQAPPRVNQNGFDLNGGLNFGDKLGIVVDGDGTRATDSFGDVTWIMSVMGGPRVYPLGRHRIAPFAEVLLGRAYIHIKFGGCTPPGCTLNDGSFAFSAGGGVDAEITKHLSVRLFEFDYERTAFYKISSPPLSDANNNLKVKVGVLFRF